MSQILGHTWPDQTRVSPRSPQGTVRWETLGMRLVSPLLQAQQANSLNACCKLSCIVPQPTLKKHRSYGPVLQEGFYPGKSRICTINNNSLIIHWKDSLILPAHQRCSKIRDRVCSPIFSEKWLCTSTSSTKWKIDWSPFLYMTSWQQAEILFWQQCRDKSILITANVM